MVEVNAVRFPVPPVGTAEGFIGMSGCNLVFIGKGSNNEAVRISPFALIERLGLGLGDPRVGNVYTTFSRLAQLAEIRALVDPNFPSPKPGERLTAAPEILRACREELIAMHQRGKKIGVPDSEFTEEFANHLTAQGMGELADKLQLPTTGVEVE